ncbi:alpha/beta fold hydrolase [Streptomyces sp. NPDC048527]|uniref:alpha/beta fold hydrolase n=1 Tax=Streptomyces sp. NPDC048527 TaxID=3365568 RepID=UPI0037116961
MAHATVIELSDLPRVLIARLGVPQVHLLGHSHGAFVAAHHALNHPDQLAGVVLYEGAPVTGPEHMEEAGRKVQEFAARHAANLAMLDGADLAHALSVRPTIDDAITAYENVMLPRSTEAAEGAADGLDSAFAPDSAEQTLAHMTAHH